MCLLANGRFAVGSWTYGVLEDAVSRPVRGVLCGGAVPCQRADVVLHTVEIVCCQHRGLEIGIGCEGCACRCWRRRRSHCDCRHRRASKSMV
jgi:hypothetical protein